MILATGVGVGPTGTMFRVILPQRLLHPSEFFSDTFVFIHLLTNSFLFSQNNDDWAGFESFTPATTTATKEARRSGKVKSTTSDNDFGSLDVKSSKGSTATSAAQPAKKPEDDAWDLLN